MPQADTWLSSNDKGVTKRAQFARNARIQVWKTAAYRHAQRVRLPKGLDRVSVNITLRRTMWDRHDTQNLMDSAKAVVDGLVLYGLIPNDTDPHIDGPHLHAGPRVPGHVGYLDITIVDLAPSPQRQAATDRAALLAEHGDPTAPEAP
jgi:hypothetical protein